MKLFPFLYIVWNKLSQCFRRCLPSSERRKVIAVLVEAELMRNKLEVQQQAANQAVRIVAQLRAVKAYSTWQKERFQARQRCLIEGREPWPEEMMLPDIAQLTHNAVQAYLITEYPYIERSVPREEVVLVFRHEFQRCFEKGGKP